LRREEAKGGQILSLSGIEASDEDWNEIENLTSDEDGNPTLKEPIK
jgi:hypothetical protein